MNSRLNLEPGEPRRLLCLPTEDLSYWDPERHTWAVEPGPVELLVGSTSADADLGLRQMTTVGR